MTYSAFDHPLLSGLLGDAAVEALFSADEDLAAMVRFEAALVKVAARHGLIPESAAADIAAGLSGFSPDITAIRQAVASDGVAVPELVRQLRRAIGGDAAAHLHFGATSQDVIDTSLMLRLKVAFGYLEDRLSSLIAGLKTIEETSGSRELTAHTRMQVAIPITVSDRTKAWRQPLQHHLERLSEQKATLPVQLGGAAGTLEKFADKGGLIRAELAGELGLADAPQWHSQRHGLAEIAGGLSLVTGSLGKFGQDIALMAQDGREITLSGGGSSSAMPHKKNPVAAELLVSLARFNATQLAGMHQALVHEQERSGAAWSLEWMILPQMVGATAAALNLANRIVRDIRTVGSEGKFIIL